MGYLIQKVAEVKIVMGSKDGKSYQTTAENNVFTNKKIGDKVSDVEGFSGYEFEITGGSDKDGFPMRYDLPGAARKKLLLSKAPGVKIDRKGMRIRKTIRGNVIAEDIKQINLNVLKEGEKKLDEIFGKTEKSKEEEAEE